MTSCLVQWFESYTEDSIYKSKQLIYQLHLTHAVVFTLMFLQQDFDQNKLEEEMRKRKERVEKWREEQRKKAIENIGEIKKELEEMKQGKKWSLEDDDGEQLKALQY